MLKTSFVSRLSKNSLLLIDVAEVDEVDISGTGDCEDGTVQRLLFKNLNGTTGYLTLDIRQAFIQLRKVFTKAPIL